MIKIILWNYKIKKVNELFKAVDNELQKRKVNVDGTIETFNDGIEQGMVLKIFDKYNPDLDICIWAYFPEQRDCNNQVKIILGKQINCLKNNMWDSNELTCNIITNTNAREMHNMAREYIIELINNYYERNYHFKI